MICTNYAYSQQWCNKPNPSFCPGNFFQNGDFEIITNNPNQVPDQDINLATGWQAMWTGGSLADLHCTGGSNSTGSSVPTPNTGVYAGMWIRNRPSTDAVGPATYREGMYNRLTTLIGQNTGLYSFTFKIAHSGLGSTLPVSIGVYGVLNPGNILASAPTGHNTNPTNINLWQSANIAVKVVLLGVINTPVDFNNTWAPQTVNFNSNIFPSGGITHIMIMADDNARPNEDRNTYVNFDDFCLQKATPAMSTCCPDLKNLIKNPDFILGNAGFITDYQFNSNLTTNALIPGQYNITNKANTNKICDQWTISDHSNCTTTGEFMVVNGRTGQSGKKKIWEQTISVSKNKDFTFCAYFKNLPSCCFDAKPKVDIKFSGVSNSNVIDEIIDVDPTNACAWKEIRKYLNSGNNSTITITILLNETTIGDGNDVAIDDIAIVEIPQTPKDRTAFSLVPTNVTAATLGFIATPIDKNLKDCGVWWKVCEYDASSADKCKAGTVVENPSQWWTYPAPVQFWGYNYQNNGLNGTNPGIFSANKVYRFELGVFCPCTGWNSTVIIYDAKGKRIIAP